MLKLKRRRIEALQEKKLMINLITSTRFAKNILPIVSTRFLKSENSKLALSWIKSYYDKYKEAPKGNLIALFNEATIDENDSKSAVVSDYLTSLSEEYEDYDINILYEIDEAKKYIQQRSVETTLEDAKILLDKNQVEKSENLLKAFSMRLESFGDIMMNISHTAIKSSDFLNKEIEQPTSIIDPWLTDGNISMIYAPRGIGKTWLSLSIAVMVSRKRATGKRFGPWEVMNESGVLYVDGEMGDYEMQKRLKILKKLYGEESDENPLTLLTSARYAAEHGAQMNISLEEYRNALYQYLFENSHYNLVILDNISSLTPGLSENSKEDWDPINQWLISLRHLGVSVILIHHSGKGNVQRGTSGREDALDCILTLRRSTVQVGNQGARFTVVFEKSRNIPPGPGIQSFDMELMEDGRGGVEWVRLFNEDDDDE